MIRVENLESNTVQQFENDVEYINLTEQSKIYFDYSASDVASSVREGDDLVLTFVDGVVVRINQYYDFVEDTAFIFFVDEAGIITPWVSGLLIASGVALIAGGSSDAAAAAEDAALAVIAAYAADNTN
ncbi:MAG: BapA prefix-like domain-containing protein, partial [Pikeienuella sp.]